MVCKSVSIHKSPLISRSVFCDAPRVLAGISSTKDESSISGILSISVSVGNSRLSLVAALKDLSNAGGASSKTLFMTFNPPNLSVNVLVLKFHQYLC